MMLAASTFAIQAQGFRVFKSDGKVYQFLWAADSIAFFPGEGDPDYQEPVPESVQKDLETLRTRLVMIEAETKKNEDAIATVRAEAQENITAAQKSIKVQEAEIKMLQASQAESEANIDAIQAAQAANTNDINALQARAAMLEDLCKRQESDIKTLQYYIEMIGERVAKLETELDALKNQ